jgi:hypothetical protein
VCVSACTPKKCVPLQKNALLQLELCIPSDGFSFGEMSSKGKLLEASRPYHSNLQNLYVTKRPRQKCQTKKFSTSDATRAFEKVIGKQSLAGMSRNLFGNRVTRFGEFLGQFSAHSPIGSCFLWHFFQEHIFVSHFWIHKNSCKLSNYAKIRVTLHIGRLFQKSFWSRCSG